MEFVRRISSVNRIDKSNDTEKNYSSDPAATKLISNGHALINSTTTTKQTIEQIKSNLLLNTKDLVAICPILLYQMTAATSIERSGCIRSDLVPVDFSAAGQFDRSGGHSGDVNEQLLQDEHNDRVLGKIMTVDFFSIH